MILCIAGCAVRLMAGPASAPPHPNRPASAMFNTMTNMVPNICLVHPCQIVWQNYQESLRCLFIEIFVNHKLKVFMKSVMAGKRSIKEVLVSVACKVLLKIKAQYTWHAAVICQ